MQAKFLYKGIKASECGPQQVWKAPAQLDTRPGGIKLLDPGPSLKLWNHSPDGFQWGYGGSGPAQLALAILFDVTGDKDLAISLHQDFKREFVAGWGESWTIADSYILAWISKRKNGGD